MKSMSKNRMSLGFVWGLLVALVLTTATTVILTALYQNGIVNESNLQIWCVIGQILSCTIGFVVAGKMVREKIAIQVGICAVLYIVVISIIGLILSDVGLQNWLQVVLSTIGSWLIACAICIRKSKRGMYPKRAYR